MKPSPIVDIEGNPYPSSFRRRLGSSPWWPHRLRLGIIAASIAVQSVFVVFTAHERKVVAAAMDELAKVQKSIENCGGNRIASTVAGNKKGAPVFWAPLKKGNRGFYNHNSTTRWPMSTRPIECRTICNLTFNN